MLIDSPLFWEQVRLGEDSGLELKEARFQGTASPPLIATGLPTGSRRSPTPAAAVSSWALRTIESRSRYPGATGPAGGPRH